MKLICGLGNPGCGYSLSRHNLGYLIIDSLCEKFKLRLKRGRGDFAYAQTQFEHDSKHEEIVFAKPTLFMNLSGIAVSQLVKQFKPDLKDLLLVCDDVNLPFGKIRLRAKGSHGGHRGLESVIYYLGTDQFSRLRVGIGDSVEAELLKDYVLQEFSQVEKEKLPEIIKLARDAVLIYLSEPIEKAMSKVNAMSAS